MFSGSHWQDFQNTNHGDRFSHSELVKGTALHLAVLSGDNATVEVVARNALRISTAQGHWIEGLTRPWKYDALSSLDLLDERVDTPLVLASCAQDESIVKTLLEMHASVDGFAGKRAIDVIGTTCSDWVNLTTPLEIACIHRHASIARLLMSRRADVRPRGSYRCTSPLIGFLGGCFGEAVRPLSVTDLELARQLIAARANVNVTGRDGKNALFYAVIDKQNDMIPLLLEAGAEVNAMNAWGDTALRIACSNPITGWNAIAVPLLLQYRADPDICNYDGKRVALAQFYQLQRKHTPRLK